MEDEKKFCDACGAPLVPGESECVACGQPINKIDAPTDAPVVSAEEWSKPAVVEAEPEVEHDRYGTPKNEGDADSPHRWGTPGDAPEPSFMRDPAPVTGPGLDNEVQPMPVTIPPLMPVPAAPEKKSKKTWIIAAVVVLVICICLGIFAAAGLVTQFLTTGV